VVSVLTRVQLPDLIYIAFVKEISSAIDPS
jgi:hypothetical protein